MRGVLRSVVDPCPRGVLGRIGDPALLTAPVIRSVELVLQVVASLRPNGPSAALAPSTIIGALKKLTAALHAEG
jgi:hypothetical protein